MFRALPNGDLLFDTVGPASPQIASQEKRKRVWSWAWFQNPLYVPLSSCAIGPNTLRLVPR